MAKFWLNDKNVDDFQLFVRQKFENYNCYYAVPEYKSEFDSYDSPRQHDLLVTETDGRTLITIEGKADEPFGPNNFGGRFKEAIDKKMDTTTNSMILDRMINLYDNYFNKNGNILGIMYQLAHWFAGSIVDAIKFDAENLILVLLEFRSKSTKAENLDGNHTEFEKFIDFISQGKYNSIKNRELLGPMSNSFTAGENFKKDLFIGYYSINLD